MPQAIEEALEEAHVQIVGTKHSVTAHHIHSYPLVKQTGEFLGRVPVARIFVANTKPIYEAVANSRPAKWVAPVTDRVDLLADRGLQLTDKWVPALKTTTYEGIGKDVMTPYNATRNAAEKARLATLDAADKYLYDPVHSRVLQTRRYYNEKIYDTKGKPLVRGSFDPVVAPVNQRVEGFISKRFPEGKHVPTDGFSNELSRSAALAVNFVQRAIPAVENRVYDIAMGPCHYVKHVNDVFNHNLDKQDDLSLTNSWTASRNAVQELNKETVEYLKGRMPSALRVERMDTQVAA
ncbi:LAMI_0C09670g1_1 [Lachancea mirantina]|uniref:LAMI_0C09670g1_1 n=1 Tax=Lachancea mirantina TaxID=1230905 RepID=A0A1G4J598_9SACH|nr:LAMI_0C09670g1_1 [Lachancea mirantina]